VVLLFPVRVAGDVEPGEEVTIRAHATWLVCERACIPGDADLEITVPVLRRAGASRSAKVIAHARQEVPVAANGSDRVTAELSGKTLIVRARGATQMRFYPEYQEGVVAVDLPGQGERTGDELRIEYKTLQGAESIRGVIDIVRVGQVLHLALDVPIGDASAS